MHTNPPPAIPVLAGIVATAGLLFLASCGGGGGSSTTSGSGQGPTVTHAALTLPNMQPRWAGLRPAVRFGDELRIGGAPPPGRTALTEAASHGDTTVSHGRVTDGVGASALVDYLQHDAAQRSVSRLFRWVAAPVLRYVEGATAAQVDELVRAVQLINANLPRDFQLTVDSTPVSATADAAGTGPDTLAAGQILAEFAGQADWEIPVPVRPEWAGAAYWWAVGGQAITTARVWIDDTRPHETLTTIVHELGHALGRAHPDPARFPDTVMLAGVANAVEGYVLHPLDREALLAVHGTLEAGDTAADIAAGLGPWEDESMHVRGDLNGLAFGASLRNGLVRPWAAGPRPGIDLEDNAGLSGSVSWEGRLLGLTPGGDSVAGAADMTIDLGTLRGDLEFTDLQSWAGAPGTVGTGATWGDGGLEYTVGVLGNLFARTGGDEGLISGAFFGGGHEGMAGMLERDDLSAGFAGTR